MTSENDNSAPPSRSSRLSAPATVSPEARAFLDAIAVPVVPLPETDDAAAWKAHIAASDRALVEMFGSPEVIGQTDPREIGGVNCYCIDHPADEDGAVYLDIHGGALVYMGGPLTAFSALRSYANTGLSVVSPDYRMPPDHVFPASLDDCIAVYRALLDKVGAERIVIGGTSAGGNLAAATVLRARNEGLPLPAALVLLTPEVDLTEAGDTFRTLDGLDIISSFPRQNRLYAAGTPLDDPLVSPVFADFSAGWPPTFLQAGTRDIFLSNTVIMHRALRRAGIDAELHVWEAMPHGGFGGGTPEDAEIGDELRHFLKNRLTER